MIQVEWWPWQSVSAEWESMMYRGGGYSRVSSWPRRLIVWPNDYWSYELSTYCMTASEMRICRLQATTMTATSLLVTTWRHYSHVESSYNREYDLYVFRYCCNGSVTFSGFHCVGGAAFRGVWNTAIPVRGPPSEKNICILSIFNHPRPCCILDIEGNI